MINGRHSQVTFAAISLAGLLLMSRAMCQQAAPEVTTEIGETTIEVAKFPSREQILKILSEPAPDFPYVDQVVAATTESVVTTYLESLMDKDAHKRDTIVSQRAQFVADMQRKIAMALDGKDDELNKKIAKAAADLADQLKAAGDKAVSTGRLGFEVSSFYRSQADQDPSERTWDKPAINSMDRGVSSFTGTRRVEYEIAARAAGAGDVRVPVILRIELAATVSPTGFFAAIESPNRPESRVRLDSVLHFSVEKGVSIDARNSFGAKVSIGYREALPAAHGTLQARPLK